MTLASAATSISALPVLVLGEARLLSHSIARVLESSGYAVVTPDGDQEPLMVVLIEPLPAHWRLVDPFQVPVLVLTSLDVADDEVVDFVMVGADAVLPVECERDQLVSAIERVLAGESALTRVQSRMLVNGVRRRFGRDEASEVHVTPRELDILRTIDQGLSVKQTARMLSISPRTVENTQRMLYRRLGVRNRAQAVARAHALGLLTGEPA